MSQSCMFRRRYIKKTVTYVKFVRSVSVIPVNIPLNVWVSAGVS